ncbi:hypothetical protein BGU93_18895, partial [Clostridioides difficile]
VADQRGECGAFLVRTSIKRDTGRGHREVRLGRHGSAKRECQKRRWQGHSHLGTGSLYKPLSAFYFFTASKTLVGAVSRPYPQENEPERPCDILPRSQGNHS